MDTCPECGAPEVEGKDCFGQLGELIVWEYQDAELLSEHFLTVASYNIQHPSSFTPEALAGLVSSFGSYLEGTITIPQIRQRNAAKNEGAARVQKPAEERISVLKKWSMTISNVYTPDHPAGAADRVREWAGAIRLEM